MNVTLVDHMGSDLTVVNAARVSYDKHSDVLKDKDIKLIYYLAEHQHWSPFAHCFLQFRIKAPVFVARQLVKHQVGLTWNEISRRYVDYEPEMYHPSGWRGRPKNSKQGSDGEITAPYIADVYLREVNQLAVTYYKKMIQNGVAPEQARMILPQSMMTEWYWSGSLHAFARVCTQRLHPQTQEETRELSQLISSYCNEVFPHSWKALITN